MFFFLDPESNETLEFIEITYLLLIINLKKN